MKQIQVNQNEVMLEFEESEPFQPHVLLTAMSAAAANSSIWNLFLVVPVAIVNEHAGFLRERGFLTAGTVSRDAQTFLKLRWPIRTSGETGSLAVAEPTLPPQDYEKSAVAEMFRRYGPRTEATCS